MPTRQIENPISITTQKTRVKSPQIYNAKLLWFSYVVTMAIFENFARRASTRLVSQKNNLEDRCKNRDLINSGGEPKQKIQWYIFHLWPDILHYCGNFKNALGWHFSGVQNKVDISQHPWHQVLDNTPLKFFSRNPVRKLYVYKKKES